MTTKVNSISSPQKACFEPETVSFSAVSLFKSRCFKIVGTAVVLAASVTWILPAALSHMEVPLDPLLIKSLLGTLLVGVVLLGLKMKKELMYEISILYTIWGSCVRSNPWWSEINDYIVLGALPLEHQMEKIKALRITHVITLLEPFEWEPGIVQPAQSQQWIDMGIEHKHIEAPDFLGVPLVKIDETIKYINEELQKNPYAKFYIHCKAGRGRSATVVICMLMKSNPTQFPSKEITYAHLLKLRRINLNENQMLAVQKYLNIELL